MNDNDNYNDDDYDGGAITEKRRLLLDTAANTEEDAVCTAGATRSIVGGSASNKCMILHHYPYYGGTTASFLNTAPEECITSAAAAVRVVDHDDDVDNNVEVDIENKQEVSKSSSGKNLIISQQQQHHHSSSATSSFDPIIIYAPNEADLPPGGTPTLLGSSKLVANARNNELRRSRSNSMAYSNNNNNNNNNSSSSGSFSSVRSSIGGIATSNSFAHFRRIGSWMHSTNNNNNNMIDSSSSSTLDRGVMSTINTMKNCSLSTTTIAAAAATTTTTSAGTFIDDTFKNDGLVHTLERIERQQQQQNYKTNLLERTHTTFFHDAVSFAEGTIPQAIIIATVIGCICGMAAYVYYSTLNYLLQLLWKVMPHYIFVDKKFANNIPISMHILWVPLVTFTLSALCGLSIYYLGEPGDLAYTIQCVHDHGYKATHHILPMVASSMFTILAGGSLGPEAPLVAICAAVAGFISRTIFQQTNTNVIRKHTFMGMAGALSAFFGVPLGGSIFALEVTSRFGIEYFEHLVEAIFAGEICVAVFRSLTNLPLGSIWRITPTHLVEAEPYMILLGGGIGLLGALVAYIWANVHWRILDFFNTMGLIDDENLFAVRRVMCGAIGIVIIGIFVPQTMFWGEFEFPILATLSPASNLPHVWPTNGLIGFEMNTFRSCIICGVCKLLAISLTVAGGYRGGFIFPFFSAGAAFGRALCFLFPTLSPSIATLCLAAGINVAITRTALATSLILSFLSGEQYALPAIVAASIASLFATGYLPFIKSQLVRSDIDFSLYYKDNRRL